MHRRRVRAMVSPPRPSRMDPMWQNFVVNYLTGRALRCIYELVTSCAYDLIRQSCCDNVPTQCRPGTHAPAGPYMRYNYS